MSTHEPPQFTPAQVLDAGRRAEAEARYDFAVQLYTHLAQHYPGTPEAGAALQGLARLNPAPLTPPAPPAPVAGLDFRPENAPPPQLFPLGNPFESARGAEPRFGQLPAEPAPAYQRWQAEEPPMPAIAREEARLAAEMPQPLRDYRSGRWLARAVAWVGALQALGGLVLLPVAVVRPKVLAGLPIVGEMASPVVSGLTLISIGVALVVVGQVARAVLEQANATRDIAALLRFRPTAVRRGRQR